MSRSTRILKDRYHFRRRHPHFGIFLEPEVQEVELAPGKRATLVYFVENDSERAVTLRAEVENLPLGWLARLERGDSGVLGFDAWTLEPGERAHYHLILMAPRQGAGAASPTLRVIDAEDPTRHASALARVRLPAS